MSPAQSPEKNTILRWGFGLPIFFAGAAICVFIIATAIRLLPDDCRPGVGDVQQAQTRIKNGMTKDEVLSLLGRPHRQAASIPGDAEWDYWETIFVGSILRVHFGPDGRVISSEWWCQ